MSGPLAFIRYETPLADSVDGRAPEIADPSSMHTPEPDSTSHTDHALATFIDASPDEPPSVVKAEDPDPPIEPLEPPPSSSPSPPTIIPAHAPLSFTVNFDSTPNNADAAAEEKEKKKEKDLSSCLPPQLLKAMKERTAKSVEAREKREQERKREKEKKEKEERERKEKEREEKERKEKEKREKEKKEKEEKERKEKEKREKEEKAEQERRRRVEKEAARTRTRSNSGVRTGRTQIKPSLADLRRRNVPAGSGSGESAAVGTNRSASSQRPSRTGSLNNGRQRSASKSSRQSSTERRSPRLDRNNSLKAKNAPYRAASVDKRRLSNDGPGGNMSEGKAYIFNKMFTKQPSVKQGSVEAEVFRGPGDGQEANSPSHSPPSDAGTYTIESDKEKPKKSPHPSASLSDDTSAPLLETAKFVQSWEQTINGKDHGKRNDTEEAPPRRKHGENDGPNVNLIFNVLSANSHTTPSDQGSDVEHSPKIGSARRSTSGSMDHRRSTKVQRSNSDTHKTNPAMTTAATAASNRHRQLAAGVNPSGSAGQRRRMSSDNTPASTPRKTNLMSTSFHKSSGMSTSMFGAASFSRTDGGRFSLKQKKETRPDLAEKAEGLRRRKEYDPHKAAADSARVSRRKEPETARSASGSERPRRTNSADTRPVTEGGRPAQHSGMTSARASISSTSNTSAVTAPTTTRVTSVRRHESLNTGSSGRTMPSRRFQPTTASLLAPTATVAGSAFLDVAGQQSTRSQSVSNGDTSYTEVAYDLLLVSSIQSMTVRLRKGFEDLLRELRERDIISRTPTPLGELYSAMPPAHFNTTNMELKEILANLKAMECLYQSMEARLIRDKVPADSDSPARGQTLGSCSNMEYREEVSRITSELRGFRPIGADDADADERVAPEPLPKPAATRRYESSF